MHVHVHMKQQTKCGEYENLGEDQSVKSNSRECSILQSRNLDLTAQLTSTICGAYTNLLRKALNVPWTDHNTSAQLDGDLPRADDII